jgi:ParB family chromosome partitioning protein
VSESVETSASETLFDARRRMVLDLLGLDPDSPTVAGSGQDIACLLLRLMRLADHEVMAVLGVVMGETLTVGSGLVELLGQHLSIDMASVWQADDALLDSIRDRDVMGHILAEVAGEIVAAENAKATTKVQRAIVRDCLTGSNGRAKREGWVPRWMAFPPSAYTPRGGVGSVERTERIAALLAPEAKAEDSSDAADAMASDTDEGLPWAA